MKKQKTKRYPGRLPHRVKGVFYSVVANRRQHNLNIYTRYAYGGGSLLLYVTPNLLCGYSSGGGNKLTAKVIRRIKQNVRHPSLHCFRFGAGRAGLNASRVH